MEQEEKTVDIVVQEYEQKLTELENQKNEEIKKLKEEHAQEVRAIISGRKNPQEIKPTENEEEEKDFYTREIEKTKKKLKLIKEEK